MLFTILFYILGGLISSIASLLNLIPFPSWPEQFLSGFEYFGEKIMLLNIIFPAYEFLILLNWLVIFFSGYYFMVLLINIFNWIRGAGGIKA